MKETAKSFFGRTSAGDEVYKYTLENDSGMIVSVISFACAVQSVIVRDRNGSPTDVVLGYDDIEKKAIFFSVLLWADTRTAYGVRSLS